MLFLIPTPIGNLKDITLHALEILRSVDLILCEDTRKSNILLHHYQISTPLRALHTHNEHSLVPDLIRQLKDGRNIALISDAGMPCISDPGYLLNREAQFNNIPIRCLPGATAFLPALIYSAFPLHNFLFLGFAPHKKGRQSFFANLTHKPYTIVIYESPYRLINALEYLKQYLPQAPISISKEISKIHETLIKGSAEELLKLLQQSTIKGEYVIVIDNNDISEKTQGDFLANNTLD